MQENSQIWAKISEILPPAWRIGAASLKSLAVPLLSFSFQLSQYQDTRELQAATETPDLPRHVTDPRTRAAEIGLPSVSQVSTLPRAGQGSRARIVDVAGSSSSLSLRSPFAHPPLPPALAIKANKVSALQQNGCSMDTCSALTLPQRWLPPAEGRKLLTVA